MALAKFRLKAIREIVVKQFMLKLTPLQISAVYTQVIQRSFIANGADLRTHDLVTCVLPSIDRLFKILQNGDVAYSFSTWFSSSRLSKTTSPAEAFSSFLQFVESVAKSKTIDSMAIQDDSVERCRESVFAIYKGCCFRPRMYFGSLVGPGALAVSSIEDLFLRPAQGCMTTLLAEYLGKIGLSEGEFCQLGQLEHESDRLGQAIFWRSIWRSYLMVRMPTVIAKWQLEMGETSRDVDVCRS